MRFIAIISTLFVGAIFLLMSIYYYSKKRKDLTIYSMITSFSLLLMSVICIFFT